MLRGPEALHALDDAIADVRREENELTQKLARSAERQARLRQNQAELCRQLAEARLPAENRATVARRLTVAETKARDMLARHAERLAESAETLKALDKRIARLATERTELLKTVDGCQADLKALGPQIASEVARNPGYEDKRKAARDLQSIASRAHEKTERAEADREAKGHPYREDPLFMYLWEAGYGTRNYKANALIKWLDTGVARLCGYETARPNFVMLNEIPLRLREHVERMQERARAAEVELDELETAAIDAAGGKAAREGLQAAQERIAAIDSEITAAEDERDEAARTRRHLAEGREASFEDALRTLTSTLEAEAVRTVVAEARHNRTVPGDAILAQIDDVLLRLSEENGETHDHLTRLKTLGARRRELEDIEWEIRQARFDDPRSTFRDDLLVGETLNEFLRGKITAAAYWEMWRNNQGWTAGSSDWGGGVGLPRGGRAVQFPPPDGGQWLSGTGFGRPRRARK